MTSKPDQSCPSVSVYYDASCPLCAAEIGHYQRIAKGKHLNWVDVSHQGFTDPDLSGQDAMARFHVRDAQGNLSSGAAAFVVLWQEMPGWRWLAKLAALPGALTVMEWSYRAFLKVRPSLQWAARALERRSS
jgi:predicted DCC family thiol-disulfide oxidoreductase YuxK